MQIVGSQRFLSPSDICSRSNNIPLISLGGSTTPSGALSDSSAEAAGPFPLVVIVDFEEEKEEV